MPKFTHAFSPHLSPSIKSNLAGCNFFVRLSFSLLSLNSRVRSIPNRGECVRCAHAQSCSPHKMAPGAPPPQRRKKQARLSQQQQKWGGGVSGFLSSLSLAGWLARLLINTQGKQDGRLSRAQRALRSPLPCLGFYWTVARGGGGGGRQPAMLCFVFPLLLRAGCSSLPASPPPVRTGVEPFVGRAYATWNVSTPWIMFSIWLYGAAGVFVGMLFRWWTIPLPFSAAPTAGYLLSWFMIYRKIFKRGRLLRLLWV